MMQKMRMANETSPWLTSQADRELFVSNLGWLLGQTREGIVGCYLDKDEVVHVQFKGGSERLVNVAMDSYMAIIRDVVRHL